MQGKIIEGKKHEYTQLENGAMKTQNTYTKKVLPIIKLEKDKGTKFMLIFLQSEHFEEKTK